MILPVTGLLLFAVVTYRSTDVNQQGPDGPHKYYWWSSLRLDTDPLNKSPKLASPCESGKGNCPDWQPPIAQVTPGWLEKGLNISALPAFLAGAGLVIESSKHGVDEVLTFMVSMPILLFLWFYFVGWLLDWLIARLLAGRAKTGSTGLKLS